jgi:hypothetical protein
MSKASKQRAKARAIANQFAAPPINTGRKLEKRLWEHRTSTGRTLKEMKLWINLVEKEKNAMAMDNLHALTDSIIANFNE